MTVFTGNSDRNILTGSLGNDELYGFDGNDDLFGGNGHDLLKGGGGRDLLDGGDGFDAADYRDSNEGVVVDLDPVYGSGDNGTAEGDRLVSIEDVFGSRFGDSLHGSDASNVLLGEDGDDHLYGEENDDALYGGRDNDTMDGGPGRDFLVGGPGRDMASYLWSPTGVTASLMPDPITGLGFGSGGDATGDTLYQMENLAGSYYFGDYLYGDDDWNFIVGLGGDDHLFGNGGPDQLTGGLGIDQLDGGSGGDQFIWNDIHETGTGNKTADSIDGFNAAEGDVLNLRNVDANAYVFDDQNFRFIGGAAFTLNAATPDPSDVVPGEIRYYHLGGDTYIEMQTGTSADVEGVIRLDGIVTPTASWFDL
jgi:Ca2+-binding RTX toxin-like protein